MREIDAGFVRYNANDNQRNVGDCVARSISFATGQDYKYNADHICAGGYETWNELMKAIKQYRNDGYWPD